MRSVGLKTLKNKLSEYVRLAANGETVLVTDRNRVVAELTPPRAEHNADSPEAKWAELIRQGIITPATNRSGKPPLRTPLVPFDQLMKELDADREDR